MMNAIIHNAVLISAFAVLWFLCLFCLFPVGLGPVDPDTGAPLSPMLGKKVILATGIASVLWACFYAAIRMGFLDL